MRQKPRKKKQTRRQLIRLSAALVIVLLLAAGLWAIRYVPAWFNQLPFMSNRQVVEFHEYFALEPDITGLILEDRRLTLSMPPQLENGDVYLPATFVYDYMDPFLFWDEYAELLFITTDTEVMQFSPKTLSYYNNNERQALKTPVLVINGACYLPADLIMRQYPYEITYQPAYNMVIVTERDSSPAVGEVLKKTPIRYRADKKSPIETTAAKGDILYLFETDGDFTRIRTADGLLGYVLTDLIKETAPAESKVPAPPLKTPPLWPEDTKINLMWESVSVPAGNDEVMKRPLPDGLNVISPTWFTIHPESLTVVSIGSRDYVSWAHEQGVQVWALIADEQGDKSHAFLTDAAKRRQAVEDLARFADELDLDGINIDFEHVREADGGYYIQFLRELAPVLHKKGVILSVDVYVPMEWSAFYQRDKVGQTADFVCVMTYDEHYSGSTSGPVASLPFVQQGVTDMLKEVPKEKLLMGLPYYNRVWRELANGENREKPGVAHYGMERTQTILAEKGVELKWDADIGSYFGEYAAVEDGETVFYMVWLENEYSIAEKLKIFTSHDLAGVAGWRRGFENEAVWALLQEACGLS